MTKVTNIIIGEEKYLEWVNVDLEKSNIQNIDKLVLPLNKFFGRMQVYCVSECCGIEAYSFLPNDIKNAVIKSEVVNPKILIDKLINNISEIKCDVVSSTVFNHLMDKSFLLELLKHIKRSL